jgi:alkylation response protein AidB-like acyl-CoA dehydrogenase
MMDDALLDDFERPLRALCTDDTLRAIEAGAPTDALWQAIDALGYTDALVAQEQGGAGLSLRELFALVFAAGKAGLGLPFGETSVARALLAAAGHGGLHGTGPIAIAPGAPGDAGAIVCRDVPGGALAQQVLVSWQGEWLLLPRAHAAATPGAWRPQASATLQWHTTDLAVVRFDAGAADAVALCNALHAAGMAGAMARVLELVTDYARDRKQFGRPIAQFQAVQQELSVLGEQAHSATLAARLGCSAADVRPDPLLAATAKLRACEAARSVCAIAHAVFGAIGITEEHVLGLYTRRLHEWRAAPGTETQCARLLGQALLAQPDGLFDFVRLRLSAPAPA